MTIVARNWTVLAIAAGALLGVARLQMSALDARRAELAAVRAEAQELARLRQASATLAAQQPDEMAVAALRSDHAALVRLREELAALRAREKLPPAAANDPAAAETPPMSPIPIANCRNVGRATPVALLETMLWAAAAGEVEPLADALVLAPGASEKLRSVLARLPEELQQHYGTPERLVALLAIKDIPLGSMQVIAETSDGEKGRKVRVRLQSPEGESKTTTLALQGGVGDWRVFVPLSAAERYAAQIQ